MQSLKKYFDKLRLEDKRPLSLFYFCDHEVTRHMVHMNQLLRNNPDDLNRRNEMIQQLKQCQHNLMNVILTIIQEAIPKSRSPRHFRAKYPDDVLLDQINGPIWFGAECIAAGSHIANHEWESNELRPYAIHLTECVQKIREALREQCQKDCSVYPEPLKDLLRWFDFTWAEFEFRYVSLMCNVKTEVLYSHQQSLIVLFSEATQRAVEKGYLTKDMVECMEPSLMFSIPRLAIVCGLVIHEDGPLSMNRSNKEIPVMFRVYRSVLGRVKELLGHLSEEQFQRLEQALCSAQGLGTLERKNKSLKWKTFASNNSSTSPSSTEEDKNLTTTTEAAPSSTPQPLPSISNPECVFEPRPLQLSSKDEPNADHDDARKIEPQEKPAKGSNKKVGTSSAVTTTTSATTTTTTTAGTDKVSQVPSVSVGGKPKQKGPAGFTSPEDLMHRLFVAISGVADQLQTNHARDLRVILKHVFMVCQSEPDECDVYRPTSPCTPQPSPLDLQSQSFAFSSSLSSPLSTGNPLPSNSSSQSVPVEQRPDWTDDSSSTYCQSCRIIFTFTRRKHHCRSCGQIVCNLCSPNSIPLVKLAYKRAVRVCTKCYIDYLSQRADSDGYQPIIL